MGFVNRYVNSVSLYHETINTQQTVTFPLAIIDPIIVSALSKIALYI